MQCYVCSVDTVNWGRPRKRMFLGIAGIGSCNFPSMTAVDGIGMIRAHLLYPELENCIVDGDYYELLCFTENNNLLYHDTNYTTCLVITNGIDEIKFQPKMFPNPTTSFLTIQSENNFPEQTAFQLFDITGRMVLQKQLTQKNTQLDVSGMSKGMYLYNIFSSKQKLGSGKLVIQ